MKVIHPGESEEPGEVLRKMYSSRFLAQADQRKKVWRVLVEHFFQQFIPENGSVLDVGCGWGEFINAVRARAKYAIDLNPEAGKRVAPSVAFFRQSCADPWPVRSNSLDVVFTSNFLEHLPTKAHISDTVKEAFRCLRPGGQIVCLGPNIRYVPGSYWDFFDHHIPLSERSLAECLETEGFRPEWVVPRFLPFTMANSRPTPLILVRTYLGLRAAWPIFGRQFLVVASKPNEPVP